MEVKKPFRKFLMIFDQGFASNKNNYKTFKKKIEKKLIKKRRKKNVFLISTVNLLQYFNTKNVLFCF